MIEVVNSFAKQKCEDTWLSMPTASIPSYIIVTQPSFVEKTNSVNSAWVNKWSYSEVDEWINNDVILNS